MACGAGHRISIGAIKEAANRAARQSGIQACAADFVPAQSLSSNSACVGGAGAFGHH